VLVLTDIFGATPGQPGAEAARTRPRRRPAGVNLPMLLRALTYRDKAWNPARARHRDGGRDGVSTCWTIDDMNSC
jgi:PTS system mannose-specific IIA component